MSAFVKWFAREYERDPGAAMNHLLYCVMNDHIGDSVVWSYLERTGDGKFTKETFERAAKLILAEAGVKT